MTVVESIIISIVEGVTEFIPISSTAHMRITENLLGISNTDKFTEVFTVAIQLGAILSVVVLYWKKFFDFSRINFYIKLIIAVIPALILGKLLKEKIDLVLEKPVIIAIIMLAGGVVLLFVDDWFKRPVINDEKEISRMKAFQIGLYQCLAIIFPGLSRSAATIIGGMSLKLTRSLAAEFSFLLAVPTMLAATVYSLYKYTKDYGSFTSEQIKILSIGNAVAFVVALLAIKFFITMLKKYGFRIWGIYRVIIGIVLLIMIYKGYLAS
ncbi:MAG: undecaprenyl-diphosphate phosphatase [Bacteroidota bacterium]|nr:undecaprenyl-diphosphate phosphatase [Bacteroidota bacterium]MDQ6890138.1 undecaprenyl-diphosphate phosphatase [Bacteroidota bacterium]